MYWTFAEIIITFYQKAHKFVTLTYLSAKPTSQLKRQYILFFNRMSKLHVFKWIRDKQATVWLWKHVYCLAFTALYDKLQVSKPLRWKLIPELDAVIRSWCDVRSQIDPQACSLVYWVWPGALLPAISLNSTHDTPICVLPTQHIEGAFLESIDQIIEYSIETQVKSSVDQYIKDKRDHIQTYT